MPLINKKAIQAEYMTANAKQLQAVYNYQRVVLNAFTEVVNRISKVQNYTKSIELKRQQLDALEASVDVATKLFNATRVEYIDVLFAQRDLRDARMVLIDTKNEQLSAIVNTYQALGGGLIHFEYPEMTTEPTGPNLPAPAGPIEVKPNDVPPAPENPGEKAPDNAGENK
jgi:outer membrane protein, multidrug efflux system